MKIKKNKIRLLYYTGTITIILVLIVTLTVNYLNSFDQFSGSSIVQLTDGILHMKKDYIQGIVDQAIQNIDIDSEHISTLKQALVNEQVVVYEGLYKGLSSYEEAFDRYTKEEIPKGMIIALFQNNGNLLQTYGTGYVGDLPTSVSEISEETKKYGVLTLLSNDNESLYLYVEDSYVEEAIKKMVTTRISQVRLIDNGYLWVNEIVDFQGGNDYAIRRIHPNMPETEGDFLSTESEDIKGNKPYQMELNGINEEGEVFTEYYFKKMGSDEISHKLSYGRLYEPFNWVVATGVYLDDIAELTRLETMEMHELKVDMIKRTVFIVIFTLLIGIVVIVFFEKRIYKLIYNFEMAVSNQKDIIERDRKMYKALAMVDSLTGLLNRRAMNTELESAFSNAKRHGTPFAIAIGDIDYFKSINDNFGHDVGDEVLIVLSDLLKKSFRAEDYVGRWGGEEFIFLISHSDVNTAYGKIENIRQKIEKLTFSHLKTGVTCTMSFGISAYKPTDKSYEEIVLEADRNLYKAKEGGRNRVI